MAAPAQATNIVTMLDLAKEKDPQGAAATIIDPISKRSPVMQLMHAKEGNLDTGHEVTSLLGLPSGQWIGYNEGVDPHKAVVENFVEACGRLCDLSQIDASLAKRAPGGAAAWRVAQDDRFLKGMGAEHERAFWYESTLRTPKAIHGLTTRFGKYSTSPGTPAYQVIPCHSSANGDNQNSLWLIVTGEGNLSLIHPKGSDVGIDTTDLGLSLATDANGRRFPAWNTWFELMTGPCIENYRQVVRICNIDPDVFSSTGDAITSAMAKAVHRVQALSDGRAMFFGNRQVLEWIDIESNYKARNTVTIKEWSGMEVLVFRGIPIVMTDGLVTNAEAIVTT